MNASVLNCKSTTQVLTEITTLP